MDQISSKLHPCSPLRHLPGCLQRKVKWTRNSKYSKTIPGNSPDINEMIYTMNIRPHINISHVLHSAGCYTENTRVRQQNVSAFLAFFLKNSLKKTLVFGFVRHVAIYTLQICERLERSVFSTSSPGPSPRSKWRHFERREGPGDEVGLHKGCELVFNIFLFVTTFHGFRIDWPIKTKE